jgi:hypothetical protein
VIVHDGHVAGIWKNKKVKNNVNLEFELFENKELDLSEAEERLRRYFIYIADLETRVQSSV